MQHDKQRVTENNILRKILRLRRRRMKQDWRKLHKTSLFVLLTRYRLGNQTGKDVMDWVHGTYYKLYTVFEWESLKVQDHLEDLGVDQKTELKQSCK
jgi:hypothetical protein